MTPLDASLTDRVVTSCWRPSWRERLAILLFGRIWLQCLVEENPATGSVFTANLTTYNPRPTGREPIPAPWPPTMEPQVEP